MAEVDRDLSFWLATLGAGLRYERDDEYRTTRDSRLRGLRGVEPGGLGAASGGTQVRCVWSAHSAGSTRQSKGGRFRPRHRWRVRSRRSRLVRGLVRSLSSHGIYLG